MNAKTYSKASERRLTTAALLVGSYFYPAATSILLPALPPSFVIQFRTRVTSISLSLIINAITSAYPHRCSSIYYPVRMDRPYHLPTPQSPLEPRRSSVGLYPLHHRLTLVFFPLRLRLRTVAQAPNHSVTEIIRNG
jgi:hypothetical protein